MCTARGGHCATRWLPALNFALSGYPYWTTDIGGYHQPYDGAANDPAYQELYARWFEFGAFCPIFRTHGHRDHNELWTYDRVYPTLLTFDRLRYRLLPYIYSQAWKVTSQDSTSSVRWSWTSARIAPPGRSATSSSSARPSWSAR